MSKMKNAPKRVAKVSLDNIAIKSLVELNRIKDIQTFSKTFEVKSKSPLFKSFFYNSPKKFSKNLQRKAPVVKFDSTEKYLFIISSQIERFKFEINEYINLRDKVEYCILLGENENALKFLDEVFYITGYSYWYVQLKFSLLSNLERDDEVLEMHKKLCKDINKSFEQRDLDILLANADKSRTSERNNYSFEAIVEGLFNTVDAKSIDFLFRFNLLNYDSDDFNSILSYISPCNVIDQFNTLSRMAITCFSKGELDNPILNTYINLSDKISDYKINNVKLIINNSDELSDKDAAFVDVCDTYIKGDFESVNDKCEIYLKKWPNLSNLYEFYANSLSNTGRDIVFNETSLLNKLIKAMLDFIINRGDTKMSVLNRLFQQFNNIDALQIVKLLDQKIDICRDEKKVFTIYRFMDVNGSPMNPFRNFSSKEYSLCRKLVDSELNEVDYLNIPEYRKLKWKADKYYISEDYNIALDLYRQINNAPFHLTDEVKAKIALSLIKLDLVDEAVSYISDLFFEDSKNIWKLPKELIFNGIEECDEVNFECIDLVITIFLLIKDNYTEHQTISLYLQDYLEQFSILHPSELIPESNKQLFLLESICDLSILDGLRYQSENDKVLDRVKIIANLVAIDSNLQSIQDESDLLLHEYTKNSCLKKLGKGKLEVDQARVLAKSKKLYSVNFSDLLKHIDEEDQANEQYTESVSVDKDDKKLLRTNKKSFNIATHIMLEIRDIYTLDPIFGLDASLNVDIRHNGIVPVIRSVFEKHDLICKKTNEIYFDNEFFEDYFKTSLVDSYYASAQESFKKFSASTDELLKRIKNDFIQIGTNDLTSTDSLFKFNFETDEVNNLISLTRSGSTFEEIISWVISTLDKKAMNLIKSGKSELINYILKKMDIYFKDLKVSTAGLGRNAYRINEKITLSGIDLVETLKDVASWLDFVESSGEHFSMKVPIDEGFTFVDKMYPKVNMKYNILPESKIVFDGFHLSNFIRIFKILFENAVKRRYDQRSCTLSVANTESEKESCFIIRSRSKSIDLDKVDEINRTVNNIDYLDKANRENNSGFYKIKRIFEKELNIDNEIQIKVDGDFFIVIFKFNHESLLIKDNNYESVDS